MFDYVLEAMAKRDILVTNENTGVQTSLFMFEFIVWGELVIAATIQITVY